MKKRNMTAMAMAAMMIMANVSPSVMAFAGGNINDTSSLNTKEDVNETDTSKWHTVGDVGNVTATGNKNDRTTVIATSISGDVTADKATVVSEGEIGGDVEAKNDSSVTADSISGDVAATDGSFVTSNGNIGGEVTAEASAEVWAYGSISGDVSSGGGALVTSVGGINGKIAVEGGNVRAYGDVDDSDSESESDDYTITAFADDKDKAKVDVLGDLTSSEGKAIQIGGRNVSVIVQGDVKTTAEDGKISIDASDSDGTDNEIAIGGALKNGKNGATLAVATNEDDVVDEEKLPEIVVGTIEDISKLEVLDSNGDALSKEEAKKVIDNIKYIIDRNDLQNGMLTITTINGGTWEQTDSSQIYKVAKAGETFKVKINVADGYELSAGNAKVERNADGSYTVTVPEGGLDLYAMLKAITATVTRSSSGGGSGSSSSGLHAIAVTPGAGRTNVPTTPGSWKKNADNTWSYVNEGGDSYKSSWIVSNSRWYYADANGRIATGWMEINGVWYYFSVADSTENPEGSMLAGTTTPDGYKLDSNGAWVK